MEEHIVQKRKWKNMNEWVLQLVDTGLGNQQVRKKKKTSTQIQPRKRGLRRRPRPPSTKCLNFGSSYISVTISAFAPLQWCALFLFLETVTHTYTLFFKTLKKTGGSVIRVISLVVVVPLAYLCFSMCLVGYSSLPFFPF